MKKLTILFALISLLLSTTAQDVFVDAYSVDVFGNSLQTTPQRNLLVAGYRLHPNISATSTNFTDLGIMQVKPDGSPLMARIYHYQAHEAWMYSKNIQGGFVLGGEARPANNSRENSAVVIARTDFRGNISWSKAFYSSNTYGILITGMSTNRAQETVFACLTRVRDTANPRSLVVLGHLVKLDSAGNSIWQRSYVLGKQFPFSAVMRGSVSFTQQGGIAAGWQVSIPDTTAALTSFRKGIAFQRFDPAGNLRWTRAFRSNGLLGMAYTPADSGVAAYALDTLNRSGLIKLGKGGAVKYAFLDKIPPHSNVNSIPRGVNIKPDSNKIPYLVGNTLTMSRGIRRPAPVATRPVAFPAIESDRNAGFADFVTIGKTAFITGAVYSPANQQRYAVLYKSRFARNVDNCFTQVTKTPVRARFPLRGIAMNLPSPPIQINDSSINFRTVNLPVTDSVACLGNGDVWPGDANSDGFAEVKDILTLGLVWGNMGPRRPNASPRWRAQPARNWRGQFINGANHKHADCDGNGQVGRNDLRVILANYGRQHNKTFTDGQMGDMPISLKSKQQFVAGQEVEIPVFLGDENHQTSLHGVSFSISYDQGMMGNQVEFVLQNSWLGDTAALISIQKNDVNESLLDIGISRTDGQDATGYGQIGVLRFTPQNTFDDTNPIYIEIHTTEGINAAEEKIDLYGHDQVVELETTAVAELAPFGVQQASLRDVRLHLHPNPVKNQLHVIHETAMIQRVEILNGFGQMMASHQLNTAEADVLVEGLPAGIYLVKVFTEAGVSTKRIVKE